VKQGKALFWVASRRRTVLRETVPSLPDLPSFLIPLGWALVDCNCSGSRSCPSSLLESSKNTHGRSKAAACVGPSKGVGLPADVSCGRHPSRPGHPQGSRFASSFSDSAPISTRVAAFFPSPRPQASASARFEKAAVAPTYAVGAKKAHPWLTRSQRAAPAFKVKQCKGPGTRDRATDFYCIPF
jgi:hypothetical protein